MIKIKEDQPGVSQY